MIPGVVLENVNLILAYGRVKISGARKADDSCMPRVALTLTCNRLALLISFSYMSIPFVFDFPLLYHSSDLVFS